MILAKSLTAAGAGAGAVIGTACISYNIGHWPRERFLQ
jgi:hypothetical protein